MSKFTATIVTANLRDVDGCDSDNAVNAIYAAAEVAAAKFAKSRNIEEITVEQYSPLHDRQAKTVIVSHDCWGGEPEDTIKAEDEAEDIAEAIGYAIDEAIQNGDWEDEAA